MYSILPDQAQDVIQELGNIGIGSAATALSDLMEQSVETTCSPMVPIHRDYILQPQLNDQVIGVLFPFDKDLSGYALFIMEKETVAYLLDTVMHHTEPFTELNKENSGMLQEITGIMVSSYLRGIAEACGVSIRIQLPAVTMDMRGSIMNEAFSLILSQEADAYWGVHDFTIEGSSSTSQLQFMLAKKSIDKILDNLEVRI